MEMLKRSEFRSASLTVDGEEIVLDKSSAVRLLNAIAFDENAAYIGPTPRNWKYQFVFNNLWFYIYDRDGELIIWCREFIYSGRDSADFLKVVNELLERHGIKPKTQQDHSPQPRIRTERISRNTTNRNTGQSHVKMAFSGENLKE